MPNKPIGDDSLESLRERMYAREEARTATRMPRYTRPERPVEPTQGVAAEWKLPEAPIPQPPRRMSLRAKILTASIAFFLVSSIVASLMLVFGNRDISANNISIRAQAPFAVAGGEEARITVSVQNNNAVAITDATLIVEYPNGTEIDGMRARELTVKRYSLKEIVPGESVNTDLRPRLFGEENEEKQIKVSIEYHVTGSAATFYREADIVSVKISSSPVSVVLDGVTSITSGQEYVLTATVISNSESDLTNVLVSAAYPRSFDAKRVEPQAVAARNTWRIDRLKPGEQTKITVVGVFSGEQKTLHAIDVSVGLAGSADATVLASVLSTARTEVLIEAPFLGIALQVNQRTGETLSFPLDTTLNAVVEITNTLPDTVHDVAVTVHLEGSAYTAQNVDVENGYFDPGANTITFDKIEDADLAQLAPGEKRELSFFLRPNAVTGRTPDIRIRVDAAAARTSDASASRDLSAAQTMTVRFVSSAAAFATIEPVNGPYPPKAGDETQYRARFFVEGGGNEYADVGLSAFVPRGVSVVGELSDGVTWNAGTRMLTWKVGNLPAGVSREASVVVAYTPTTLDVGKVILLLQQQSLSGIDRFTKDQLSFSLPALTTETGDSGVTGRVVE